MVGMALTLAEVEVFKMDQHLPMPKKCLFLSNFRVLILQVMFKIQDNDWCSRYSRFLLSLESWANFSMVGLYMMLIKYSM